MKRSHSIVITPSQATPKPSNGDKKPKKTPKDDNRPKVKIHRKKKTIKEEPSDDPVSSPEPSLEPVKNKRKKGKTENKPDRKRKTEHFFPLDSDERMGSLFGTVVAIQKAVRQVLDDHVVRCTVPLSKIAAACRKIRKKLEDRRVDRYHGSVPALEATIHEAIEEIVEDDIDMNKSIFYIELRKYMLIGMCRLFKLEETTFLKFVQSLAKSDVMLFEYEKKAPKKLPGAIHEYFSPLTKHDFDRLSRQKQLQLRQTYLQDTITYHEQMEAFLKGKHLLLQGLAEDQAQGKKLKSKHDPFMHWPEGRTREIKLADAFRMHRQLAHDAKHELSDVNIEIESLCEYWPDFRAQHLKGRIGVRSREEEEQIRRHFLCTPMFAIKALIQHQKNEEERRKQKEEEEKDEEEKSRKEEEMSGDGGDSGDSGIENTDVDQGNLEGGDDKMEVDDGKENGKEEEEGKENDDGVEKSGMEEEEQQEVEIDGYEFEMPIDGYEFDMPIDDQPSAQPVA